VKPRFDGQTGGVAEPVSGIFIFRIYHFDNPGEVEHDEIWIDMGVPSE
jgi:hypothetical protein